MLTGSESGWLNSHRVLVTRLPERGQSVTGLESQGCPSAVRLSQGFSHKFASAARVSPVLVISLLERECQQFARGRVLERGQSVTSLLERAMFFLGAFGAGKVHLSLRIQYDFQKISLRLLRAIPESW